MKKINKSKVIIPALAMIALTTAASATGTVAWFAANGTVTASTMTFKAVAGANLYIKEGASRNLADLVDVSATLNTTATSLTPCTISAATGTATAKIPNSTNGYATAPTVSTPGSINNQNAVTVGTITKTSATDEDTFDLDNYVAVAHVTIARKQTNATTFKLTPSVTVDLGSTASELNKAIKAAVIINDNYYATTTDNITTSGDATFAFSDITGLADNTAYSAALLLWFEGEDADCTSNNAVSVSQNSATWTFTSADWTQA